MTGMVMSPVTAAQNPAGSLASSFRIAAVIAGLSKHLQFPTVSDPSHFFCLCLSLARAIDNAVANSEVPSNTQNLYQLLKEVCQRKNDPFLQAAVLVLMISAKSACKFGWFAAKEAEELSTLANEVGTSFCSQGDTTLGDPLSAISVIMSRFYPLMKMGHILVSLEVKPGFGAYVVDFHILKNTMTSPHEKIRLFVAQIDNTETSACIISPQQVSFLLNGKAVEKRTNVQMDTGPQIPTNVNGMLKYGTNLLQAVGDFNGHYIIAVAFMSAMPLSDTIVLQDYVQADVAASDPDSDIIEGPSRVSLNCPISYTRIRTPVKGQSCKHLQCFDLRNFVDINSRRPSWRCPHCNQNACYTDLRIDQNIDKVLKEVGEDVSDVIISADGSWKALFKSDSHKESNNLPKELPQHQEHGPSSPILDIMDLTNDDIIDVDMSDIIDTKPSPATLGSQPAGSNLTMQSILDNATTIDQDDFWSSCLDLDSGPGIGIQPPNSMPELPPRNFMTSPLVTHNSSTPMRQANNNLMSQLQSQLVNNLEYGRLTQLSRNASRNPIAVQALPVPSPTVLEQQRVRAQLDSLVGNGPSLASQASMSSLPASNGLNANSNMARHQQQIMRSQTYPVQSSLPSHLHSTPQVAARPSLPTAAGLGASSGPRIDSQNLQQQDNRRLHARSPSPGIGQSSSPLTQSIQMPIHGRSPSPGIGQSSSPLAQSVQMPIHGRSPSPGIGQSSSPLTQPVQMTRQPPSVPVQFDATRLRSNFGAPPHVNANPGPINIVDNSLDEWRPAGRMRGSITGDAVAAYGDMVIRATTSQPAQQSQPNYASIRPNGVPANLQAFIANSRSRNSYAAQTQPSPTTQPATSTNGGPGSGMASGSLQ
ncbi:E4 SUMO-protein ligase PIAL2 [Euphorbia peplus]|nr:E4 SUMO-protein ligase PIAL2 [Euphorbia peplus]